MKNPILKFVKNFTALCLALFLFGGEPGKFGQEKTFFHGYLIPKPIIRVGLGVNLGDVEISASSGMKIYEVKENYKLIADDVNEVLVRGHKEKLNERFVVQVAHSEDHEEAEKFAQNLRSHFTNNKVYVSLNSADALAGDHQVRVGDFLTRGDALEFIKQVNKLGIKDTWIIREEITEESKPLWILVDNELKSLSDDTILYFIPSSTQSYLSHNGRDYHGIFILQASPKGVVLVNLLNMEDYLKSVVPSELSPHSYRELEALKAQAVAARTYAIKNMGNNEKLGFDLCDTPKSQFYKGINAEHPLSTQAVEETMGEVAIFNGKLIDALYTSTCGGVTENVENVFLGPALPYLRSTVCVYENQKEWVLNSENTVQPVYINGRNVAHEMAVLMSLDILDVKSDPVYYMGEASLPETVEWLKRSRRILGKPDLEITSNHEVVDFVSLAQLIVDAFDLKDNLENLFKEPEKDFILKDMAPLENGQSEQVAFLIQSGIFPDVSEIKNPHRNLLRGEIAISIHEALENYEDLFHEGEFRSFDVETNTLIFDSDSEEVVIEFPAGAFLVKRQEGSDVFSKQLVLLGGEHVRWIEKDGKIRLLEIDFSSHTNILDRSSTFHSWKVRRSIEDMETLINRYYPVGKLLDIKPQNRGESKRVSELLIEGKEGQALVRGLRIKSVLKLRDTLFVIEREKDTEGRTTYFNFSGRGWGHGVGLCQVGAFGMAQAGAEYQEILKKYYYGIKIDKIY